MCFCCFVQQNGHPSNDLFPFWAAVSASLGCRLCLSGPPSLPLWAAVSASMGRRLCLFGLRISDVLLPRRGGLLRRADQRDHSYCSPWPGSMCWVGRRYIINSGQGMPPTVRSSLFVRPKGQISHTGQCGQAEPSGHPELRWFWAAHPGILTSPARLVTGHTPHRTTEGYENR